MKAKEFLYRRLVNQQISFTEFTQPEQILSWMVVMQAQEYAMAKWAIGLRLPGSVDSDIESAFNDGRILRTHLLRPTWHFVCPTDIRWLLALSAPRIKAISAIYYRRNQLDQKTFSRSIDILQKILQGGQFLTRIQIKSALEQHKIIADGERLALLMMYAELEGIICSGPRRGKQFTYALLDERAAFTQKLSRKDALSMLTLRYFRSRGPATLQDFATWSGLTVKDSRIGLEAHRSDLLSEMIDGREYIYPDSMPAIETRHQSSFLVPDYDEYGMSYKYRDQLNHFKNTPSELEIADPSFTHGIVINGQFAGKWKRTVKNNNTVVAVNLPGGLNKSQQESIKRGVKRYIRFSEKGAG